MAVFLQPFQWYPLSQLFVGIKFRQLGFENEILNRFYGKFPQNIYKNSYLTIGLHTFGNI